MPEQLDLFAAPAALPAGFKYEREVISRADETELLARFAQLPFREFEFHGYTGKRRTVSYGHHYDFAAEALRPVEPLPAFLLPVREKAAEFAGVPAVALEHALITEYAAGAGIGWHRDKGVFRDVIGISLLSGCRFRLRRRAGGSWARQALELPPRSAYLLRGPVRDEWEHSIPAVDALRYSITFRNRC